jgi:hypothetical protein
MKVSWLAACTALLLITPGVVRSQEKPAAEKPAAEKPAAEIPAPETVVPVKLQVVLTEYEGTNKVSSLPYTIPLNVPNKFSGRMYSLRMGVRVPVPTTSSKTGENSLTYVDVGTNIDSNANHTADGRYAVDLRIERSSLYVPFADKENNYHGKEWTVGEAPPGIAPMIRQFRGDVALVVRDGQPSEATMATDPLSGRVLKIEVVLTVLK